MTSLSQRLREQTRELHTIVERTGVMGDLLRGQVSHDTYCQLLRNLHAIYAPLEQGLLAHRGDPLVGPACMVELFRCQSLVADLETLQPGDWRDGRVMPATRLYAERLGRIGLESPRLLLAHAYVRYLGDLNGGQVLQRIVRRSLNLTGEGGTRFYQFGSADKVQSLIARFRAALAAVPAEADNFDAIVSEAQDAFRLHASLFEQLIDHRSGQRLSRGPGDSGISPPVSPSTRDPR